MKPKKTIKGSKIQAARHLRRRCKCGMKANGECKKCPPKS